MVSWSLTHLQPGKTFLSSKDDVRLRITATPGRHGPPVVSFALPEVMGSILEFQSGMSDRCLRMYITDIPWSSTR